MIRIGFHNIYAAMTANPYLADATCINAPPSQALAPYIRCFWGSAQAFDPGSSAIYGSTLIVPDTCFDLLLIKDNEKGAYRMTFLGMNSTSEVDQWSEEDRDMSLFAVRFPFWAVHCISPASLKGAMDQVLEPEAFFPGVKELCEEIFDLSSFAARISRAEAYMEKRFAGGRFNASFFNGVELMLREKGCVSLERLSGHLAYSCRQTQRIFRELTGASPKQMADLVRYQFLWQEMVRQGSIDYQDMVYRYGYTDQSHLIRDFKKYHSMTPREALRNLSPFSYSLPENRAKIIENDRDMEVLL